MKTISIIWTIFGILFLSLSIFHFYQSTRKLNDFKTTERPYAQMGTAKLFGADFDQLTKDLVENLNAYVKDVNKSNKWINITASVGYVLASATAFLSLYLTFKP